jgi:hypothetical protein
MVRLSVGVLMFFAVACLVAFWAPLFQNRQNWRITFQIEQCDWRLMGLVLLPFALLHGAGHFWNILPMNGYIYFTGAILTSWLLSKIGVPEQPRGLFILLASVILTFFLAQAEFTIAVLSVIWGLLVWKAIELFYLQSETHWEDVLPALIWLVGLYWINLSSPQNVLVEHQGLLLNSLGIALIIRLIQTFPFHLSERFFIKPLLLATIGKLLGILVINNLLLAPSMQHWAWLFAGGILLVYILQTLNKQTDQDMAIPKVLISLALIGVATLIASRLFGTLGWMILASTALVAPKSLYVLYVGLFLIARTFLQSFIVQFNPNVTGINLLHSYTSAALYGGILLILLLPLLVYQRENRLKTTLILLAAGVLVPLFSSYVLHAEPTGSLLVASTVTALIVAFVGPLFYTHQNNPVQANMLILPLQMVTTGLLASELLNIGNTALRYEKILVLAVAIAGISFVWFLVQKAVSGREPVQVTGD